MDASQEVARLVQRRQARLRRTPRELSGGSSGAGSRHGGAQVNIDAFTDTRWITMRREPGQYPL
ncbi:hypothetical protein B7R21_07820 [Subtercola boreus]|uniref:Uncharacterized protein n=1 Tax=Subtercola boreus TaxID=120213 RepID=A0A3E0VUL2_9MICO|nr:hypothetical protein B7R21_07820 [Subtercola boreus]